MISKFATLIFIDDIISNYCFVGVVVTGALNGMWMWVSLLHYSTGPHWGGERSEG